MSETLTYGVWKSSLSAEIIADKGIRYGHMCVDSGNAYWLESRAKEKGRNVLVQCDSKGNLSEPLPEIISVRSKVHEYGSGDFIVDRGVIYFCNGKDQCVYRLDSAQKNPSVERLTQENQLGEDRYADFCLSADKSSLVCVRERHQDNNVINELVSIDLLSGDGEKALSNGVQVIHTGFDFYSFPRFSEQGHRLCWTCWNQPDMPWDAAELWLADYHGNAGIDAAHKVVGGNSESLNVEKKISIYQPMWSKNGILYYISDASGWSNIYSLEDGVLNAHTPIDREFGIPQWSLASSSFVITPDNQIFAVYIQNGNQSLCHINTETGHIEPIALPFKYFAEHLILGDDYLYFCAAGPAVAEAIYQFNWRTAELKKLSKNSVFPLPIEELSIAEGIEFPSKNGRTSYAFYYRPHNTNYLALENTQPPLIVMSHGGPTGMTNSSLNSAIQFWTHRGFAVVDVNYGGSTGYGNKYRNSLKGKWGIVDVEDCISAAEYLVSEGKADKNSLLIRGGSAGGYTTLCALTFYDVFAAGCSRYGVADLESLAADSHKFEARYLDSVVGSYPEMKSTYQARSPIHHTDKLSCPILLLQGEDDKVVPPNQAEMMVDALDKKQIPYAYRLYKGEGHGFRKAENIVDALNSELSFYHQVLSLNSDDEEFNLIIKNI